MLRMQFVLSIFLLFICSEFSAGASKDNLGLSFAADGTAIFWNSPGACKIQIGTPEIRIKDWLKGTRDVLSLKLKLIDKTVGSKAAVLMYAVSSAGTPYGIQGTYRIRIETAAGENWLVYRTQLDFDAPVRTDVTVQNHFKIDELSTTNMLLPERDGFLRSYPLSPNQKGAGRFELGAKATHGFTCNEIGIPVAGLELQKRTFGDPKHLLAVSMDPYCGGVIHVTSAEKESSVVISTTYNGVTVPLKSESRTMAFEFVSSPSYDVLTDPDYVHQMLMSFYRTIPEIKPGADWIHDIHLVYFEYLSDDGRWWYEGLQHLADRIPEKYRDRVAVCLHGWYDYFLQYGYDHAKGELLREWVAFPRTRKINMSLEKMHGLLKFSKNLGFRTLLYFADGTNSDSGFASFRPEYTLRDRNGDVTRGWVGPDSVGRPLMADPSVPALRDWYKGYLHALIKEYGDYIDGFVWDETFYIPVNTISYSQETPAYSDRAMMSLVSELAQIVQSYHHKNPDLVFLASDLGRTTYALTAHGTYQDSAMRPDHWAPSMFINYRNCLWSCLWYPVTRNCTNEYASKLGIAQALSKGWGDNVGPHEMPEEMLKGVIDRFMKNVKSNTHRVRYFAP